MNKTEEKQAYGLILVTFFIWGSVYIAGKFAGRSLPSYMVACLRCMISMIPLWMMSRKYLPLKIAKEDLKQFMLVGFLGYFLTIQSIQLGISLTGASMAALINALTPVGITIFAAVLLGEKITPVKIICLVLALAGTCIISMGAETNSELLGMIAVLVGVAAFSIASVLMRRLSGKYPPVLITTVAMSMSLLFHVPVCVITAAAMPYKFTTEAIFALLYLGFAGSGLAQVTWAKVLSILPASTCSLFYPLQPMFAAILGALLLNESFTPAFFAGLVLISLDVVLNTAETRRQAFKQ